MLECNWGKCELISCGQEQLNLSHTLMSSGYPRKWTTSQTRQQPEWKGNRASPEGRTQERQCSGLFPEGLSWMALEGGHSGPPRWLVMLRCLDRISRQVCSCPFHTLDALFCLPRPPSGARCPSPLACCQMKFTPGT